MIDTTLKQHSPSHWPELDLLRGFAAILMVLNHAGVAWFGGSEELPKTFPIFDFGSNAPVMFFLATGIGTGLQWKPGASQADSHAFGLWKKVGILVLADQIMVWGHGHATGMDFLGFIALSMLCLEPLKRLASPLNVALAIFVLSPLIRFGCAVAFPDSPAWLSYVSGRENLSGFSYPIFPWISYPFLGFIMGFLAQRHREALERRWVAVVCAGLALGLFFHLVGFALVASGREIHRWGSVSLAFFVFSFGVITCAAALSILLCRVAVLASVVRGISLRGISSLSVVPIHYVAVLGVSMVSRPADEVVAFTLSSALVCALSFSLARATDRGAKGLTKSSHAKGTARLATAVTALAGISLWVLPQGALEARTLVFCLGQMALCFLLVLPLPGFTWTSRSPKVR